MKKTMKALIPVLLVLILIMGVSCKKADKPIPIKNPDTFIFVSYGTLDSLDPTKAYDNASGGAIQNIYEGLIGFKGSSTSEFEPILATEVPTVENGGISADGKTYTFKIRKGVKFHSGNPLRPEDVQYSILRNLVVDAEGGPNWMWYFSIFGIYGSLDDDGNFNLTLNEMKEAVKIDGDNIVITLKNPFAPFLSILAGYWGSILDKEFIIANGGWDGTEATMKAVNRPAEGKEKLYDIASGTGPYKLDRWEKKVEIVLVRNDDYWGPKPACKYAINKIVDEWATRKLMLLNGDADTVWVDPMYFEELNMEKGLTVHKDLIEMGMRSINFNMAINDKDNPYLGSGKLDGEGIPSGFFSDKNVRIAFTYCWDQETFIRDVMNGAAVEVYTPVVKGLPYFNESLKPLAKDLKKAEEYLKKAWGGQVWEKGFKMDFIFNQGNEVRESGLKMLAENIKSLNPKFKINVRGVEWAQYLDIQKQKLTPTYFMGWGADYPDPDNFVQPFMHSQGYYAERCGYNNPEVDSLVEEGAISTNPERRKEIYYRLQDIWLEDMIGIIMHQPAGNRYFRDWVKGYVWHPMENQYRYNQFSKEQK